MPTRRWAILVIAIGFIIGGGGVAVHYGLDYYKQVALITHLPQSQPSPAVATAHVHKRPSSSTQHHREEDGAVATSLWAKLPEPGSKLGTLSFPQLNFSVPVVQGTHWDQLKLGVGHFMASDLPGQGGNVFLSGHRDTVFAPLRNLKVGDTIVFHTQYGPFEYRAKRIRIVPENAGDVVVPTNYETLTLSTCYPFFYIGFAPKRFVVYTSLVSEPNVVQRERAQVQARILHGRSG